MVQTVCRYLFSSLRNFGDHLKKSSNFEQRDRKYVKTWGSGARERGQKSLQKYFYCIPFAFITFFPTLLSLFCASKVETELQIYNFTILRTVIILVLNFRQLLLFRMR